MKRAAGIIVLGLLLTACAFPRQEHIALPQPERLDVLPLDPDQLPAGRYRLQLNDHDLRPGGRPRQARLVIEILFTLDQHRLLSHMESMVSDSTGNPVESTHFTPGSPLVVIDYDTCRSEAIEDPPTGLSARAFLTDTVGPLPPYGESARWAPTVTTDDGEVKVQVSE